jgi:hypothetical protein
MALPLSLLFNLKIENMKTSNVSLQVDKCNHEEIPKKAWIGRVLKCMVIAIVLSWPALLSCCAVGYETPDYEYGYVVPEYDSFGVLIDPWDVGWRHSHAEWIHQHPHWRHDYSLHRRGGEHHEGERH